LQELNNVLNFDFRVYRLTADELSWILLETGTDRSRRFGNFINAAINISAADRHHYFNFYKEFE
jgi:hypothetical protein